MDVSLRQGRGWVGRAVACLGLAVIGAGAALAQSAEDGFLTGITGGYAHTVVVDGNGKIMAGGEFTLESTTRRLARLHPDGRRDSSFNAGISATAGYVRSVLPVGSGYLVGGTFTGGSSADYLVQLTANGNNVSSLAVAVNGAVFKVAPRFTDNGYYIGGQFTWVNGATRHRVARLTSSLTSDGSFVTPTFSGTVHDIVEQADGKVIVAGSFLNITGNPGAGYAVFRLNANGSLDSTFRFDAVPAGLHHVGSVALLPDGKLLIGGNFTATVGDQQRRHVARLNSDGSVDLTFQPPTLNGPVGQLTVQPDGRVVIVGDFTGVGLGNRIARLHENGAHDGSLNTLVNPNDHVRGVAVQSDGGVLFAGHFTSITTGIPALRVARLPWTGSIERPFEDAGAINGDVNAVAVQADGHVLAGGAFTSVGGTPRTYLARFGSQGGALLGTFTPSFDGAVNAIVVQPDGRILVGGAFTVVNGVTRRRLVRLNSDGTLDTGFVPVNLPNGAVNALALDPLGNIYVGGSFTGVTAQNRSRLIRLLANGSVDADFADPGINDEVLAVAMAADDYRVYIAGRFTEVAELQQRGIARIWPNGALNTSFNGRLYDADAVGYALAVVPDGSGVIVGGSFESVQRRSGGTIHARRNLARFNDDGSIDTDYLDNNTIRRPNGAVRSLLLTHDGRLYLGGAFSQIGNSDRLRLARLQASGTLDSSFNVPVQPVAGVLPTWLNTMALQGDGRLLVAGRFDRLDGVLRSQLGRIGNSDRVPVEEITRTPTSHIAQWRRNRASAPLASPPQLFISTTCCSAGDFSPLPGAMTWNSALGGNWRYTGFPTQYGVYYLQVRGYLAGDSKGYYRSPIYRFDGGQPPANQADLEVIKIVTPEEAAPGDQVQFTVQVRNVGPDPAPVTVVRDELPSGYTYISHSVDQGSYDANVGEWQVGTLNHAAGANTRTLTMTVTVNPSGDYLNVARVQSQLPDPDESNNQDSAAVIVIEEGDDTIFANGFETP